MTSSSDNNIVKVALAEYTPVSPIEVEDRSGWINYGADNQFPTYLIELAETSPVHGALCTSIAQMVAGKEITGLDPATAELIGLDELVVPVSQDLVIQGGFFLEVIWTLGGEIANINHLPFECCRIAADKDTGEVTGIYYSRDWSEIRKKRNKPCFIPLFTEATQTRVELPRRQAYFTFSNVRGSQYYGKPSYWSSVNWIELTRQIGMYHVNNIMNGFFPSFIVNFFNGIPDPEQKAMLIRDWEKKISGARNAGKALFTFNESGTEKPDITTFPLSDADKQYQFLSEESTHQIMIGHRVTSPLLFGIRDKGGLGSNANEIREAYALFESQVIRPLQAVIEKAIKDITGAVVDIVPFAPGFLSQPQPEAPAEPAAPEPETLSLEKKKGLAALSEEEEAFILGRMEEIGETIDSDEWELMSEDRAEADHEAEVDAVARIVAEHLASEASYAKGGEKSEWGDSGLYKLRYAYSQNLSDDTRPFCRKMVALSQDGKVYRYEDIQAMGADGVNGSFAPAGQSTYDIFTWKGGVYCHHFWKRQIYFRKREGGKFLPNKGLENDKRVGNVPFVPKKGAEGVAPINTPTRGSLKNP